MHSIRNSCLLITFLDRAHKHQLWDFFNSYSRYHYLPFHWELTKFEYLDR